MHVPEFNLLQIVGNAIKISIKWKLKEGFITDPLLILFTMCCSISYCFISCYSSFEVFCTHVSLRVSFFLTAACKAEARTLSTGIGDYVTL